MIKTVIFCELFLYLVSSNAYYNPGDGSCPRILCDSSCKSIKDFRGCDICLCSASVTGPCAFTDCGSGLRCIEEKVACPSPNCDLPQARCVPADVDRLPQVSTTPSPPGSLPVRECLLPADPGPCEAAITRWYFSSSSVRCETFQFGGCLGNENNFMSRSACESICMSVEPATLPCPVPLCVQPDVPCMFGFALDERGCQTCDCAPGPDPGLVACPAIGCVFDEPCEYGQEVGDNGCPTCQCAANPCFTRKCPGGQICQIQVVQCIRAPCPPLTVCVDRGDNPSCLNQVCDDNPPRGCREISYLNNEGCVRCERSCEEPPPFPCPEVMCLDPCPEGYATDDRGCQTCDCPFNRPRPGFCPVGIIPVCARVMTSCRDDAQCSDGEKCCQIGCEMRCSRTVTIPPPQPPPLPGLASSCAVVTCIVGTICVETTSPCGAAPCPVVAMCQPTDDKPGSCPPVPEGTAGICIQACQGDASCPADNKCCSNGCGNVCMAPVAIQPPLPVEKPGNCPPLAPDAVGICIQACDSDSSCPTDNKCCSNGCGNVCMSPVEIEPPVQKPGNCPPLAPDAVGICIQACEGDSSCAGDNKCCSNGCGNVCMRPVEILPPLPVEKPGNCPQPAPDAVGICIQACEGDSSCAGGEKCCSNGCGNVCMTPVSDNQVTAGPGPLQPTSSPSTNPNRPVTGQLPDQGRKSKRKCIGPWCLYIRLRKNKLSKIESIEKVADRFGGKVAITY